MGSCRFGLTVLSGRTPFPCVTGRKKRREENWGARPSAWCPAPGRSPSHAFSPFALQDFLKYSKKASLDTSELEVPTPALGQPPLPQAGPTGGVPAVWGALCSLEGRRAGRALGGGADRRPCSLPTEGRGGHVRRAKALQRHDERWAAARVRRKTLPLFRRAALALVRLPRAGLLLFPLQNADPYCPVFCLLSPHPARSALPTPFWCFGTCLCSEPRPRGRDRQDSAVSPGPPATLRAEIPAWEVVGGRGPCPPVPTGTCPQAPCVHC